MATFGNQSRIIVGPFHHSGHVRAVNQEGAIDTSDTTVLTDTGHTSIPGLASGKLDLDGLYNVDATPSEDYYLANRIGSANGEEVSFAPQGFAITKRVTFFRSRETSYVTMTKPTDAVAWKASLISDGPVYTLGVSLGDLAAIIADGNGTTYDGTASSANGGAGVLHVTAFSGFTGVAFKVQHSTDGSAWSDLLSFASVAGVTSEIVSVTGTVNRYLRSFYDVTGTGSTTFQMSFSRK